MNAERSRRWQREQETLRTEFGRRCLSTAKGSESAELRGEEILAYVQRNAGSMSVDEAAEAAFSLCVIHDTGGQESRRLWILVQRFYDVLHRENVLGCVNPHPRDIERVIRPAGMYGLRPNDGFLRQWFEAATSKVGNLLGPRLSSLILTLATASGLRIPERFGAALLRAIRTVSPEMNFRERTTASISLRRMAQEGRFDGDVWRLVRNTLWNALSVGDIGQDAWDIVRDDSIRYFQRAIELRRKCVRMITAESDPEQVVQVFAAAAALGTGELEFRDAQPNDRAKIDQVVRQLASHCYNVGFLREHPSSEPVLTQWIGTFGIQRLAPPVEAYQEWREQVAHQVFDASVPFLVDVLRSLANARPLVVDGRLLETLLAGIRFRPVHVFWSHRNYIYRAVKDLSAPGRTDSIGSAALREFRADWEY